MIITRCALCTCLSHLDILLIWTRKTTMHSAGISSFHDDNKYHQRTCCTGDDLNKKSPPHELLLPCCETNSSSKETRDLRILLPQPTSPPHPLLLSQSCCTIACASSITHGLSSTAYKILWIAVTIYTNNELYVLSLFLQSR